MGGVALVQQHSGEVLFDMGVSHGVSENLEETMGNHGFNPQKLIVDHPVRDLAGH